MKTILEFIAINFIKEKEVYLQCYYQIDCETGESYFISEEVDKPYSCSECHQTPHSCVIDDCYFPENNKLYETERGDLICGNCHCCYGELDLIEELRRGEIVELEDTVNEEEYYDKLCCGDCGEQILPNERTHVIDLTDIYETIIHDPKVVCDDCYWSNYDRTA